MNETSRSTQPRRTGPLRVWLVALVALVVAMWIVLTMAAAPANAQSAGPQRTSFTFLEDHLTISVRVDAPGVLRITRGSVGILGVAGRAVQGFTAAGLAEPAQDHLNLTAVGAEEVAYLVTVPAGVRVRIQVPGRRASATMGGFENMATFRWDAAPAAPARSLGSVAPAQAAPPGRAGTYAASRFHVAYAGWDAPRSLSVADLRSIRTLTVRWQGDRFRVLTEHRSQFHKGDPEAFGLRAKGPPQDIVVVVPRIAEAFTLRLGGAPALILNPTRAVTLCEPVVAQKLEGNRQWFTFTPVDGTLACRSPARSAASDRRST